MTGMRNWAAGLAVSAIFGFSFLFTRSALDSMGAVELMFSRFLVAALCMALLAALGVIRLRYRGKKPWSLLAMSLLQPVAYFLLETQGVRLSATSTSGIVLSAIPAGAALAAVPLLGERLTPRKLGSVLLAVAGVALVALAKGREARLPGGGDQMAGILFLGGAVAVAVFYNVLSRKLSADYSPAEITFAMMWTGAIAFGALHLALSLASGSPLLPRVAAGNVLSVLYLGVLSSVAAFFLMNYNLARLSAASATVFLNLVTVVAIAAGVLFRGERPGWLEFLAAAMILLGVTGANTGAKEGAKGVAAAGSAADVDARCAESAGGAGDPR